MISAAVPDTVQQQALEGGEVDAGFGEEQEVCDRAKGEDEEEQKCR